MEITITLKNAAGEVVTLVESFSDLSGKSKLKDVEQLVRDLGHKVLPEIEVALLKQISREFVGEKNKEEERYS
jgi:hypothetical protein